MSKGKTVLKVLSAVGLTAVLGGSLYLVGSNWESIKAGINGEVLFTQSQVQEKVDQAYNDGVAQGEVYKAIIDELTSNLTSTQNELAKIQAEQEQSKAEIASKNALIESLTTQIEQINSENAAIVEELTNNVNLLESEKKQLQERVQENIIKINDLNEQITELQSQISDGNTTNQSLATQVNELTAKVEQLNADLNYYKELLEQYKEENKVSVTFKFDGQTHDFKFVEKGSKLSDVTNPSDTDYVKFKYWSVDGINPVDFETYIVTENTVFVAVVDRYFDATFKYEESTLGTIKVLKDNYATFENPENTTYKRFNGWKVNGVKVDLNSYPITANTVFEADIVYSYDVHFSAEGATNVPNSQVVENGTFATVPNVPMHSIYRFKFWSIDGSTPVDLNTYPITQETTFIAVWQKEYEVTYYVAGVPQSQQIQAGTNITFPELELEENCELIGWTTTQGNHKAENFDNHIVTTEETYYAIIKKTIPGQKSLKINIEKFGEQFVADISDFCNFNVSDYAGCDVIIGSIDNPMYLNGGLTAGNVDGLFGSTTGKIGSVNYTSNGIVYRGKITVQYNEGKLYCIVTKDVANTGTWTSITIDVKNLSYYI